MSNSSKNLVAGIIITISVVLSIVSVWDESLIVDEIPHVGSGYSYLATGDYRLNPEHPPLPKDLGTFPLLFLDLNQSAFEHKSWTMDLNGQWEFGRNLVYESGNDAQLITHAVKMPMLLFFVLSAILVFKWGRRFYGDKGAFIALILFSFSPTIMAHSRFVTTDLAALFGVLSATYFFINYLREPSRKNFWFAALFFGIALLCKFSTILLVFFFLILSVVYGLTHLKKILNTGYLILSTIAIMAVGFIILVWPVYYLHTMNYPVEKQYSDTQTLLESYGNRLFADPVVWASGKPVIRAAAQYGLGLLMATQRSVGGNTTYFLGEVSRTGWRSYFPIVYFIKEPLPFWGLVVIALLYLAWQLKKPSKKSLHQGSKFLKDHFPEFAMLLWLAIYWGTSIHSTLNIGVRHLLPVFPFTILLVSGQASRLIDKSKKFLVLIAILLVWFVYENLHIFPYYLTYFNQTVGGAANGSKYVVDSNLDWGQDLVRFSSWVKQYNDCVQLKCDASSGFGCPNYCYKISDPLPKINQTITKIEFDYFGWADPYYYMGNTFERLYASKYMDANDFLARNQTDGWMAISATFLNGSEGAPDQPNPINYLWLHSFQPVTVIGNSIFIYHITK